MKIIKKISLFVLFFLLVFTLSGCKSNENSEENTEDKKISLNVQKADLIASITDNERYLNKDYLYELEELDENDKLNIIITTKSTGLLDRYNEDNLGYSSLTDYVSSSYANRVQKKMTVAQETLAKQLIADGYINEVNHSYTTLIDGFSAQTTYGQYLKLVDSSYEIDVIVSEVYSEPEYKLTSTSGNKNYDPVTNFVKVYETGIFDSSNVDYDGTNTSVAILDSGFDIHHSVFQKMPEQTMLSMDYIETVLDSSKAYGYHQNIKVQDVYINEKIPFAYDYADKDADVSPYDSNHGTHVAGIIGGKDDVITGVAVNTQLVLMKVFGDFNNGAIQDDILAALEDAILIGVDAINLSLGTACGFSSSRENEYINEVYNKIEAAGISLVVAASNDYSSGYGGAGSNTNKASNPDSATVGSPSTFPSTISVASISGVKSEYVVADDGYTFFFNNANSSSGKPFDFYEMLFDNVNTTKNKIELEYVTIPGVGKKVNYSSIDVKGKIALVKRGETSFEEKAQVALSQGAIGCIIYNNISGDVYMNAGSKLEIPLCSISKDDGEHLASKSSGTLTFDKTYLAGPFMSDFSSWGPVSDLTLKPEITAHGGSITSSVPGGGYDEISGTSMASPNLCGVVILVKQALKERYPEMSAPELTNMANSLLMSTATIVLNEEGNPYSPRKQGSGLGNLEYAVETKAYLSVDGQTKPKLELKDDPNETGVYVLKFNVHNTSSEKLQYRLTDITMTESLSNSDPEYVSERSYMLNPNTEVSIVGAGVLDGDILTVNENGTVAITYKIKLTDSEKSYLRKSFINGMYVEGFGVLKSLNEDGIDLSIPYLAFFGDWTVAPMFDKTYYEVESEAYNGAIDEEDKLKADYYASTPLGRYYHSYIIPLGSYVYEIDENKYDKIPASEEHASIGYYLDTINGITTVYAGLLRNAKTVTYTITNEYTGEVVYERVKYDARKAYFSGSIVPNYDIMNVTAAELGLENNTKYNFKMIAELDYGDGGLANNLNNTFDFSFYVDYQAPTITDAQFYSKYDKSLKDYRYYVDVYVYDNHYAQSIRPFTLIDEKVVSLSEYAIPVYGERGEENKVTVEITDYMDLLQYSSMDGSVTLSNGLGFVVDDYALNQNFVFVNLPGTSGTTIKYQKDYYSSVSGNTYQYYKNIQVGDMLNLNEMLTSDDPNLSDDPEVQSKYFSTLAWSSSDENIIKVNNGQIEAVGEGTAVITCTNLASDGYNYSIKLKIRVRNSEAETGADKLTDINFTYFETLKAFVNGPEESEIGEVGDHFFFTDKSHVSFYPSEQVKLYYELEPWNLQDYELIWSSTNEKVATVDDEGVVTALKEGTATISLKVKVGGRQSTLMASTRVVVKNEFIVEGNTLVAYKGLGGNVVIPDDEGILYIGAFAFSLYTTDYEIEIKDDDYDAAKTPSTNNTVVSVTIPADVKEVKKYAFYNCTALESVEFLKANDGTSCPFIREYAFFGDTNLVNINLEDVELIGSFAFMGCTSLIDVDLSGAYAIGEAAFKDCTSLEVVDITTIINGGKEAFANCTSLRKMINGQFTNFAEGMFKNTGLETVDFYSDRIPANCFENCSQLMKVTIHNDLVYVGNEAFKDCSLLEEVVFEEGVRSEFIYDGAFSNCAKLTSVVLPDSDVVIEENVFENCSSLETISFNTNTRITRNDGSIFKGCVNLSTFVVEDSNPYYSVKANYLCSKDGKVILLVAPKQLGEGNITIEAGIEKIGESAFSGLDQLKQIDLSNVKTIGNNAFSNCTNLTSVILSDVDVEVGEAAFSGCTSLNNVTNINKLDEFAPYVFASTAIASVQIKAGAVICEGAFKNNSSLETLELLSNDRIGDYAFSGCSALESITIDSKEIGKYAFNNCVKLSNVSVSNVLTIDEGAFMGCVELETISLDKATLVGDYAFADCLKLANVSMDKVEEIGNYAFAYVSGNEEGKTANSLTSVNLPNTLTTIGDYAFYLSTLLTEVNIGSNLQTIGKYAFSECVALESFNTTSSVETISEAAFAYDEKLTSVNIKDIIYVEEAAFMNCLALTDIDLSKVEEIKMQAFNYCQSLTSLDLQNVITLAPGAFLSCAKLANINMPKVEVIDAQALSCIDVEEIKLPESVTYIAPTAFYYNSKQTKFTNMDGDTTCVINDYVRLDQGVLYTVNENNKYSLSCYPTAKADETYEVLFNTVRICEYAGYFNRRLTKLIFPDTLELIGNKAFYGSVNLKTIEFRSTEAPILEGTIDSTNISYDESSEIYQTLNKYFLFNGFQPLYYGQFKDMVGLADKMNIIIPANAQEDTYKDLVYRLYFKTDEMVKSDYVALDSKSIDYLNKVQLIPNDVKLNDEMIIKDARTAYNLVTQDLTQYGYTEEYLNGLLTNLSNAETKWNELKMAKINKNYSHILANIEALGSTYDFNKISTYYEIVEAMRIVARDDKKYIDTTSVDSFKKGFDEYFDDLNEDIDTITTITTLPTTPVNKVGLAVASAALLTAGTLLFFIIKKKWML